MSTQRKPLRRTRVDRLTTAWMVLAALFALLTVVGRGAVPQSWWVAIHLITLGVLTNAILQWSWYFSRSLLRLSPHNRHGGTDQVLRQLAFNVALVLLIVFMTAAHFWGIIVCATVIGALLAWHGLALAVVARERLASRFSIIIRYYVAAAACFVVACILAGFVTATMFASAIPQWLVAARSSLTLAHSLLGALGWIGLSIAGTLITLWPTILRTRVTQGSETRANSALWVCVLGLATITIGCLTAFMWLAGVGLSIYTLGIVWGIGIPLFQEVRRKRPSDYAGWSVAAGIIWLMIGLGWLTFEVSTASTPDSYRTQAFWGVAVIGIGGILQIFVGSLTYLMPVVIGGGPAAVRTGIHVLNQGGSARLSLRNTALVCAVLGASFGQAFWGLVLVTYAWDLVAFARAGIVQAKHKQPTPLSLSLTPPRDSLTTKEPND